MISNEIKEVSYDTLQEFGYYEKETGEYLLTLNNGEIIPIYLKVLTELQGIAFHPDMIKGTVTQDGSILMIKAKKLVIEKDVVLTPEFRCKGLVLFCDEFINYGKVSMTARGCIAKGQDIILFRTTEGVFDYVPAIGGQGGDKVSSRYAGKVSVHGKDGVSGVKRATGGGGSGGARNTYTATWSGGISGSGTAGTSYSGGTGGGGAVSSDGGTPSWHMAGNGVSNGGAGGYALKYDNESDPCNPTAGVGNPSGGTGGLLVIFATSIDNKGSIESNGTNPPYYNQNYFIHGGASGGGSLNIFCTGELSGEEKITANGGISNYGGAGGNGCVTITRYKSFLIKFENSYYSIFADHYNPITRQYNPLPLKNMPIQEALKNYGMPVNLLFSNITVENETFRPIDKFNHFSLILSDFSYVSAKAIKSSSAMFVQTFDLPLSEIASLNSIISTYESVTENTVIRAGFSCDAGDTWFMVKDGLSALLDCTIPHKNYDVCNMLEQADWNHAKQEILLNGMSIEAISSFDWNTLKSQNLRFSFVIQRPSYEDILYFKRFQFLFDEKGYYKELDDPECDIEVFDHSLKITSHIDAEHLLIHTIL